MYVCVYMCRIYDSHLTRFSSLFQDLPLPDNVLLSPPVEIQTSTPKSSSN